MCNASHPSTQIQEPAARHVAVAAMIFALGCALATTSVTLADDPLRIIAARENGYKTLFHAFTPIKRRAGRIMPGLVVGLRAHETAQMGERGGGGAHEAGETRALAAENAPDQAEQYERQRCVAGTQMPGHVVRQAGTDVDPGGGEE